MGINYNKSRKQELCDCCDCDHRGASFFCEMTQEDLSSLSVNKSSSIYKSGQVIFNESNRPHGLYCIYEGKVKLSKIGNNGKEQILRIPTRMVV